MQACPRSQKSRRAHAENQLSIAIDPPRPSCGFEIQSQRRSRSALRSTARVRPADVFEAKTRATVAEVIRPAFQLCGELMLRAKNFRAAPPANPASISPSLLHPSLRAVANPEATALPVWSETKTVGAALHRT